LSNKINILSFKVLKLYRFLFLLVLLCISSSAAFAQQITKATGGINISADNANNGSWTNLSGPEANETAAGQISIGTIKFEVPQGFEWDFNGTAGTIPSVTITTADGFGSNPKTQLEISYQQDQSSNKILVFDVTKTSNNGPQRPGKAIFENFRLRPTQGSPLRTGKITNSGNGLPSGGTNYGDISTKAGATTQVRVETKADGTGQILPAQNITAGNSVTAYAISRDQFGNFKQNISADTWSLINKSGGVVNTDLSISGDAKSAEFNAEKVGSTDIRATKSGLTSVNSETQTVVPAKPAEIVITTQPSLSVTAGQFFSTQPELEIRDSYGNLATNDNITTVTATRNKGTGTLQGDVDIRADNGVVSFTDLSHNIANTINLTFSTSDLSSVTSNNITVNPGPADALRFVEQPTNRSPDVALDPAPSIQITDAFGNDVSSQGTDIELSINSSTATSPSLSGNISSSDASGLATFPNLSLDETGTYTLIANSNDLSPSNPSENFKILQPGVLADFKFFDSDSTQIDPKTAGNAFDIKIVAVDGRGKVLDGSDDLDLYEDKVLIRSSGNLLAGGEDSTASFSNGVLSSHSVNLSTAGSITLSATNPDSTIVGVSKAFQVNPNIANTDSSRITVSEDTLIANGTSQSIVEIILEDQYGNELSSGGDNVTTSISGSGTLTGINDNGDGTYTDTLTAPVNIGSAIIGSTVNGQDITSGNPTVEFVAGPLSSFRIEDSGTNNGTISDQQAGTTFYIKITAKDVNNNTIQSFDGTGNAAILSTSGSFTKGTQTETSTFINGVLSSHPVTLKNTGTTTITARKKASSETGTSNSFNVSPGPANTNTSTITPGTAFLQLGTNDNTTITVQLKDEFGNNLTTGGNTVTLSDNGASSSLSSVTDQNNGTYTATLTAGNSIENPAIITGTVDNNVISDDAEITITDFNTWTSSGGNKPGGGGKRSDWSSGNNWSQGNTPETGQVVIIPSNPSDGSQFPILNSDEAIDFLQIENNATLNVDPGNTLTINKNISGDGAIIIDEAFINVAGDITIANFNAGSSTVTLNGTDVQQIPGYLSSEVLNIQNNITSSGHIDARTTTIDADQSLTMEAGSEFFSFDDITINGQLIGNESTFKFGGDIINSENLSLNNTSVEFNGQTKQAINGPIDASKLIINNPQNVIFNNNVIVSDTLDLDQGILTINSDNELIANTKVGNLSNIRMRRIIGGNQGWRMIAPPLASTYQDFLDGTITQGYENSQLGITGSNGDSLQPNVLYYDESFPGTDNQRWRAPDNATKSLTPGRGLFVYFFGDISVDDRYNQPLPDTLSIQGAENDGNGTSFTFPVTYTADADTGFNMVGNPFAATIDWDDGNWTKENIDNVIYVWDPSTNSYKDWNGIDGSLGDGFIKPFQAFWVKANGNGTPTLSVNKSSKTTGGTYYGKSHKEPASIGFKLEADTLETETYLTLTPDGSNAKDRRDAYRLLPFETNTYLELYTTFDDGTEISINNLARSFGKEISIPMHVGGFKDGQPINGEYTLSWPKFGDVPEEWTIILEDKENDERINLRKNTFYSFNLSQSQKKTPIKNTVESFKLVRNQQTDTKAKSQNKNSADDSRFVIRISPGADGSDVPNEYSLGKNYPNPFSENTTIEYNTPVESEVQIHIYDILGRKVKTILDERRPADYHKIKWAPTQLASGVYIVVMRAEGKQFSKKITYIK